MKDGGYKYFIQILSDQSMQYEYRTMAAFVLSMLVDDYRKGQVRTCKTTMQRDCCCFLCVFFFTQKGGLPSK